MTGSNDAFDVEQLPVGQRQCRIHRTRTGNISRLMANMPARLIVLAPDETNQSEAVPLIEAANRAGKNIALVPPMNGMSLYGMDVQNFFGSHTVLLWPKRRVEKRVNRFLKRALDLFGASVGLLLIGGPILFIAMLIRRDGAPPFYYQMRVGLNGKPFKCWKLRSMVPNSKEILEELLANDADARAEWERDFKLKNDPRITRIGHFIRKTSLDELPQLWNVLKGDMSLVGPRPIVEAELEYYGDKRHDYLAAKPGLTGLWQVSGRNDTSYAYRVYLDSWYVAHWSIWTDIVIIIQTIGTILTRRGAY